MSATYLACLTPPGTAGLATFALCGPNAWDVTRDLFEPAGSASLPDTPAPGSFWFGRLGEGNARDEVVLALKAVAPQPLVEIHCHGGVQVVALLRELFSARGVEPCRWQDFRIHAGTPRWQVEAEEALAQAPTVRTAAILLDQYHGALNRALAGLAAHLQAGRMDEARKLLDELTRRIPLGKHLVHPWHVVIAGPPNVGKSSLVNALAGYARSIVSPLPGTTRDVVTTRLALDGWPVELADTAGWRHADEPLEQAGIDRARAALDEADLVLWLVDGSTPLVLPDATLSRLLLVINKVDLAPAWDFKQLPQALHVSAKTGAGVTELCQQVANVLIPDHPGPGAAVPFTDRLGDVLENLSRLLADNERQQALQRVVELAEE